MRPNRSRRRQPSGYALGVDIGGTFTDLVLLDLNLPRISGDEVLKRLRGREIIRRLPVFVFSTSNDERDVRRCRELGADDYVRKPVDFVQFAEEVTRLARRWLKLDDKPSDDAAPKHPQ